MCRGHLTVLLASAKQGEKDGKTGGKNHSTKITAGQRFLPPLTFAVSISQSEKGAEAEVDFEIFWH